MASSKKGGGRLKKESLQTASQFSDIVCGVMDNTTVEDRVRAKMTLLPYSLPLSSPRCNRMVMKLAGHINNISI